MRVIRVDLLSQVMSCVVCADVHEIPRKLLRDQHELLVMQDTVEQDHRECREYADNPRMAALQRGFRKRCERETKAAEKPAHHMRRTRCNGHANA